MIFLGRLDPVLLWPEVVAAHAIGGGGFVFVPLCSRPVGSPQAVKQGSMTCLVEATSIGVE